MTDISYVIPGGMDLEGAKKSWLEQYQRDYPGSPLMMEHLSAYALEQDAQGQSVLKVSVPEPSLPGIWIGTLQCSPQQQQALRQLLPWTHVAQARALSWQEEQMGFMSWAQWRAGDEGRLAYRVYCQQENLLWVDEQGMALESSWDLKTFPKKVSADQRLQVYHLWIQVGMDSGMEVLERLQSEAKIASLELLGIDQQTLHVGVEMKGDPRELPYWEACVPINDQEYQAIWKAHDES